MGQIHIDTRLIANGNCGIPSCEGGAIHYHVMPTLMADYTLFALDMGVSIISGCCRTETDHVATMVQALVKKSGWPFDSVVMQQALGQPWPDIPENLGDADRHKSCRSRRKYLCNTSYDAT